MESEREMKQNESFSSFNFKTGVLSDMADSKYPCRLHALAGKQTMLLKKDGTYYVYVYQGIAYHNAAFPLVRGMYASLTDGFIQTHEDAMVVIIERIGFKGMTNYGGPVEPVGRLRYIDGCTDSLLVPPVKMGDPCLNHLHFPPGINQTMHTHPSVRIGLVANGRGECVTPFGNVPLRPGMIFIIHPENGTKVIGLDGEYHFAGSHCFRTDEVGMDVIAWHPDSDFGPTDEDHPMINRTIVDGVSAKYIDEIRTK